MNHTLVTTGATALFALTLLSTRIHASPPQYTVTDLGSIDGVHQTLLGTYSVNATGQVVGVSDATGTQRAVRWSGTVPTYLGDLPGASVTRAFAINDFGQVAGDAGMDSWHAVRWTGTTPTDLGPDSHALGINNTGQLAGSIGSNAVRWTGTTPEILLSLGGDNYGHDINESGQVVGYAYSPSNGMERQAAVWTGITPTYLSGLGGTSTQAFSINDTAQVAGTAQRADGQYHAVRWTGTTPTDLGTLGGTTSYGWGINESGDVTGVSLLADNSTLVPFLYTSGTMYDLNDLLLPGSGVTGLYVSGYGHIINDFGQIAATGSSYRSQPRSTPIATATAVT